MSVNIERLAALLDPWFEQEARRLRSRIGLMAVAAVVVRVLYLVPAGLPWILVYVALGLVGLCYLVISHGSVPAASRDLAKPLDRSDPLRKTMFWPSLVYGSSLGVVPAAVLLLADESYMISMSTLLVMVGCQKFSFHLMRARWEAHKLYRKSRSDACGSLRASG